MRSILISAVAVLVLGAVSAQAQSAMDKGTDKEVIVNYGDLDVTKADGAEILMKRVSVASADVCGYQPRLADLAALRTFKACSEAAEARAIKTLPFDVTARIAAKSETVAER